MSNTDFPEFPEDEGDQNSEALQNILKDVKDFAAEWNFDPEEVELALIDAMEPKDPFDETVDMLFETLWLLAADEVLLGRDHAVNLATVRSRSNQLSLKLAEETQWFVSSSVSISDPLKEWGKIKSIAIRTEKGFKERMEEAKKQVTKDWTVKDYYTVIKKVLEDYGIL